MNNNLEIGKPLPEELRMALKEETSLTDWTLAAAEEGKVSPYTIRDIVKGFSITENAFSTVLKLIERTLDKIAENEQKQTQHKAILSQYQLASH